MKAFLVIGMGRFGRALAYKLAALGHEVVIADNNAALIEELAPDFVDAHIADCTNPALLKSIGIGHFDVCVVCAGENFQASLEITDHLKELGARYIVSKANRENQAKFLLKIGADEVVYPEKEMAEKTALRFGSGRNILDFIALTPQYAVFEIPVLPDWIGQSLAEANVRRRYNLTVLAVKNGTEFSAAPCADYVFRKEDLLIVFGKNEDAARAAQKIR